ncbi:hypothetical protein KDK88_10000, partial [bacterium]|nr:hypothetical protein [bacterium]
MHAPFLRRLLLLTALAALALGLGACNDQKAGETAVEGITLSGEVFGNGLKDLSPVIARVGDLEITQHDLELRHKELPTDMVRFYSGEDWERRFLRFMVDEALLYQQSVDKELYLDALVSQQLIAQQRSTIIAAYRELELFQGLAPSEEDIKAHYEANKQHYMAEGAVHIRHIECLNKAEADAAWEALHAGGRESAFPYVVSRFSKNIMSAREAGDLGWVSNGGFVRFVKYGKEMSEMVYGWEIGLHEPVPIGDRWQIIEVLDRRHERQLTLNEVRERVIADFMPSLRKQVEEERLDELRKTATVELYGEYAPGFGRTPEEIFQHGVLANDPDKQLQLFDIIIEEFPDSEFVPKALFMKANIYLDTWGDTRRARGFLLGIVRDHPDSELAEQARFMMENM